MTASVFPRITKIECETVILDCPPYSCASKCPGYNRDPCVQCTERPVLSRENEIVMDGGN